MKAFAIAGVNLRRTLRERQNLFFVFLFPMLLIFVLGAAFGGTFEPRLGLVVPAEGTLAGALGDALRASDGLDVRAVGTQRELIGAVERGELDAGVVIPDGYDRAVRAGGTATVRYVTRPTETGQQVASIVQDAVQAQSGRLRAARFVAGERGESFDQALARADEVAGSLPQVSVSTRTVGSPEGSTTTGRFDTGASTQLLLFLFLTSLTSAVALVETRRLGLSRRMLATPTPVGTVLAGEALGRFAVSAVQGVFVMLCSALIFGVNWGNPLAATVLMGTFALVGSGAGMLLGAVARTSQFAVAVGLLLGMGMGALGGTMMPLEFFSPTMRAVSHALTPHAWAVDAFTELVRDGGGLVDIAPQLGVLFGVAVILLALASWRLRRAVVP